MSEIAAPLGFLLNFDMMPVERRRVLNGLSDAEHDALAQTIDHAIEEVVRRETEAPPAADRDAEVWWIRSDAKEPWAGLRIATFRKTVNGFDIVIIHNEMPDRNGVRDWTMVQEVEGWRKIRQIHIPQN